MTRIYPEVTGTLKTPTSVWDAATPPDPLALPEIEASVEYLEEHKFGYEVLAAFMMMTLSCLGEVVRGSTIIAQDSQSKYYYWSIIHELTSKRCGARRDRPPARENNREARMRAGCRR